MRRGSFSSASPYPKAPTGTLGMSQSMLSMSVAASAGSKRPRTITAQAEALVLHHHNHTPAPGKDQVVVGIAAAAGDDVEDWSGDFVERSPRGSGHDESGAVLSSTSARNSERFSGTGSSGDGSDGGLPRLVRGFPRSTSLFHRPSFGRRSWQRQHSFDSGIYGDGDRSRRSSRIRKSSNDVGETPRSSSFSDSRDSSYLQQAGVATSETGSVEAKPPPPLTARVVPELDDEDDDEPFERRISVGESLDGDDDDEDEGEAGVDDDDDDEDEDWDAEFGFTDPPDDDELKPGGAGFVDPNRRRSDNFNIFLRGFHDMMAGEDLMDDDDDFGRSNKSRNCSEEPLFQRRRSDMGPSVPSVDGSVDAIRSSLTSLPGTTEYSLLDKYRLLDVACSSSYAVRIEKFPKPCTTFSNLERNAVTAAEFPMFTDNRLEQWLMNVTGSKCDEVNEMMAVEHANTPNPRQQKNHQFRTLVSIPFGKRFVDKCFKQISVYRFYGEEKSNRELIRVFFEKLATAGIADEYWSSNLSSDDLVHVAGVVMEVLQEAARMYGPVPANGSVSCSHSVSGSSSTSHYSSATAFWMRQFQTILTICLDAFPTYRNVIAMIELRFVCHHLVGLANGDLTYSWQICNQYPEANVTLPAQPIAGQSAPIIANEILQYYGALIDALQADIQAASEARSTRRRSSGAHSSLPQLVPRYCTSTDPISLLAMVVCDIQTVYSSRSALSETMIPELGELFEFDDDDSPPSYYEFGRGFSRISSDDRGFEENEQSRVSALIKPSSSARRRILEEDLYVAIDVAKDPLVKARCAAVLSSMHSSAATNAVSNSSPRSHLKIAESLAYESLRILEWVTSRRLRELKATNDKLVGDSQRKEHLSSLFSNDGLVSEMGREILENLGNLLVTNHKYRYGILCLEAATDIFSLLNQGRDHDRIDRLMCTLTLQADDIKRALPLHEKVAASCLRQGNTNEYVFLTQTLTGMWLREGHFSRAEEYLSSAFTFLRDQTSLLPPFFLSALNGASPGSEAQSTSSRSGTVLTASSSASSNGGGGGSFVFSGSRGHTSEMDLWLNHDITLHLLLRDLYRASGRFVEGMRVLEYLLNYSGRLPRGKRTQLRMLLAEDSLQLRVLDTTRYMFHLLDQEANFFCDRILQSTLGGMVSGGNSSGGFGSNSGGAGSSSGGRSLGGMGSEARFCFDMVLSVRYIIGRAKLYLQLGELRYAYAWLSLAHIKNERESFRTHAKLHVLDGRVLMELLRRQHEHRVFPEKTQSASYISSLKMSVQASVDEMLQSFTSSLYVLTKSERQLLRDRLINYCDAAETPDKCMDMAVQAYWSAYDLYQTLDDGHHQLKSLLGVIQCQLTPIERSFFALGSSTNDELLVHLLGSCAAVPRKSAFAAPQNGEKSSSTEGTVRTENDTEDDTPIEKVRKTLQDCQQLLRQALNLSEQLAEPNSYFRTLVFCSQTWTWLERLAPYKSERPIKEAAAFWDEAVKVMKAVFFRRVAFECTPRNRQTIQRAAKSGGLQGATMSPDSSTFCLVPILNFRESIILRLEGLTLQLITTACQLQQFERVPEYVEDVLLLHIDELLSARMCLNSVAHQLRSFRSQQQHQSVVRHIPLHSIPGPTSVPGVPAAKGSGSEHPPVSRSSFSSNSLPGVLPSTPLIGASGTKRKGHKKNQSMSSISELLASSSSGPHGTSSSFHDLSLSFVSTGGRGTVLSGGATPRTGLASLSDRLSTISITSNRPEASPVASGVRSPTSRDSESELSRLRMRSRSAPQPISPVSVRQQIPTEILSPVNESNGPGGVDMYSGHHVIDLKDVRLWSTSAFGEGLRETFAHTNATSSSTGAIGIYDFDDVQSERLWWIFNAWRASKENYITGKIEVSSFRHQNLKTLRMLLDAFDPQQVAVLYIGDKSSNSMPGFDVAHINSHTFLEDRGFVLCMGYDDQQLRATSLSHQLHRHQHHSRLEFKIFKSIPDKPITWRQEIPRADWYLSQHHFFDGSATSSGEAVLRTMRLLGAKLILKLVGALLLENSLVVIGSSFPLVKEVTLCLVRLLRPFRWHHTFLSFLPIPSWRFLADTLQHHVHAQLAGRPRTKMSLGLSASEWRWGSPRAATAPSSTRSAASTSSSGSRTVPGEIASEEHEPPFIIGTMSDTWQTCLQRLRTSSTDERLIPAFVNVLDLDDLDSFATAKSSLNAVPFPRKFRKQFMERFDKVVKQRRKVQEKSINVSLRQRPPSAAQVRSGSHSIRSAHSRRSQERHSSRRPSLSKVSSAAMAFDDDRLTYDNECATAFMSGLHDFYDRLSSLSVERAKKMQGKKKHSKRQEIKSWFSSTHEFDAFVDRFLDTSIYQRYELEKNASPSIPETSTVSHGTLSRSSSGVTTNTGPRSGRNPLSMTSANSMAAHSMFANASLVRSFGSRSSTSSSFNGPPSTSHLQL